MESEQVVVKVPEVAEIDIFFVIPSEDVEEWTVRVAGGSYPVRELYISAPLSRNLELNCLEGFGYVLIRGDVAYISGPETRHDK